MREGVGKRRIPVAGPSITDKESPTSLRRFGRLVRTCQRLHRPLRAAFAEYLGVRHAVSLPSATSAIHLSLVALGIGPGDEVIVPGFHVDRDCCPDRLCRSDAGLRRR